MKKVRVLGLMVFLGMFSACTVKKISPATTSSSTFIPDAKLWASLFHQRAAEYRALCFQAYNIARLRVDQTSLTQHQKPLAIITDIDETVLDNSPNTVSQGLKGKDWEPASWYAWTAKGVADTLPGSASFFKYAASKGITVFYITNREENEREGTLKNLQKFNFPNADAAHLFLKQNTSGKEARRQQVMKDYEVVLLLGDNLSDFSNLFDKQPEDQRMSATNQQQSNFGKNFIVLPNVSYGDWESSLYKFNNNLSPAEKERIIKASLKGE